MRALFAIGAAALLLGSDPTAADKRNWYFGIEGGAEFDGGSVGESSGWAGFVTVGTGLTEHLSLEGEVGYRSTGSDGFGGLSADVDQLSFIGNLIYEAPLSNYIAFAVGVGIGGDQVNLDYYGTNFSKSEMEVIGQLKLGLSLAVTESTDLVANYRYTESITSSPVDNSTLTVGLRFEL